MPIEIIFTSNKLWGKHKRRELLFQQNFGYIYIKLYIIAYFFNICVFLCTGAVSTDKELYGVSRVIKEYINSDIKYILFFYNDVYFSLTYLKTRGFGYENKDP